MRNLKAYLGGLLLTFLATAVFASLGWVTIGAEAQLGVGANAQVERALIILVVAAIIWTMIYIAHFILWGVIILFASCTLGIGLLVGLVGVGYAGLKLAEFLLPAGWLVPTVSIGQLLVMGAVYALIDVITVRKPRRG